MRISLAVLFLSCVLVVPLQAQSPTLSFSNRTTEAGISHTYVPAFFQSSEYLAAGASGDFNRDGFEDLFLLSGGNANGPDRLYINQGNSTFVEQGASWGLTAVHHGLSVSVADYDGDGWLDVYVASNGTSPGALAGQNKLYHNNAGSSFTDVAVAAGVNGVALDSFGSSWGDYDLDGDLDLFVTGFNFPHKNRLYRNNNNGTFTDVTTASNLIGFVSDVFGFATRFADMNGDRYPELLIAGDFNTSRYFRNNGNGTFTKYNLQSGTCLEENGMGQTVGDFNRDGKPDWYVTSIYNPPQLPTPWTGNKLYLNQGSHLFTEVSAAQGVDNGGYAWGTVAVDFNHDRWLDIAETNGAQFDPKWVGERKYLWLNNGNGSFSESSQSVNFNTFGQGRGMLNLDYDNDGDQDLFIMNNNEPAELWRNDLSGSNKHWLRVRLDTNSDPGLAQDGYGSVVRVTAAGVQQSSFLTGGDNVQSQSELRVHFGLGAATLIDELRVEWPNGRVTRLTNVAVDQNLTIKPTWTIGIDGLTGAWGPISLQGTGTLAPLTPATIALTGAAPGVPGILFFGLSAVNAPFKGGLFVPAATFQIPFTTNGAGGLTLAPTWPAGLPSGFAIWFQAWFGNAGGPFGAASSNSLKALTP